jgi:hypothetical protein
VKEEGRGIIYENTESESSTKKKRRMEIVGVSGQLRC